MVQVSEIQEYRFIVTHNDIKILKSESLEGHIYNVYNENNTKKIDYNFCGGSMETNL